MPRYHFDLVDSRTVADQGGRVLPDDIMASEVADLLAEKLRSVRPELRGKGYEIMVTNDEGEEVHRAPLDKFRLVLNGTAHG
jgi:hypothetical protein